MKRHCHMTMAAALLGAFAISTPSRTRAQDTGGVPRTVNERVVTETPTPPPANSDALRAAEGRLVPGVPPAQGAVDPARALGTTGAARDQAMDPAGRPPGRLAAYPAGMDVAILAEHALGMAIEGSALRMIADRSVLDANGDDPAKMLRVHADRLMVESRAILSRPPADAQDVAISLPTRRFNLAAHDYITTLAALATASPSDSTRVALINHAVKEVLDADHIRQMGRATPGSMAMEQLLNHARTMKDEGTQTILRLAGNGPIGPNVPATVATLARRGREVIDAAGELGAFLAAQSATSPAVVAPVGPNPGRFQDNRPEIIGGTYGTSNPTTGTYSGKGDPLNPAGPPKVQNSGSPVPSPGDRNNPTTSSGGLPPK